MRQMSFAGKAFKREDRFGGSLLKGNARTKRTLDTKLPLHVVLRSTGEVSMRLPKLYAKVNAMVEESARKHGVTLYEYANVSNHLHLLVRVKSRRAWSSFIRELAGRIALLARTIKRTTFWAYKPFTRVVRGWRKAFRSARDYVTLNRHEAEGVIKRGDVKNLRELYEIWGDG